MSRSRKEVLQLVEEARAYHKAPATRALAERAPTLLVLLVTELERLDLTADEQDLVSFARRHADGESLIEPSRRIRDLLVALGDILERRLTIGL